MRYLAGQVENGCLGAKRCVVLPNTLRQMGKVLGGRAPELCVAGGAGKEKEFGGGCGQRANP